VCACVLVCWCVCVCACVLVCVWVCVCSHLCACVCANLKSSLTNFVRTNKMTKPWPAQKLCTHIQPHTHTHTHTHVWHDSFMSVTWRMPQCDMTRSCVTTGGRELEECRVCMTTERVPRNSNLYTCVHMLHTSVRTCVYIPKVNVYMCIHIESVCVYIQKACQEIATCIHVNTS